MYSFGIFVENRLLLYHILYSEKNVLLYPETEKRLHRLCPTVSAHIVSGTELYDGVVETLLNRIDGSPMYNCIEWSEEDKYLRKIGLRCDMFGVYKSIQYM